MFRQVRVDVLGLVENMSYRIAPKSGERIDVFGAGGGRRMADEMLVHLLGELPLDPDVRLGGDSGNPVSNRDSSDPHAAVFHTLAANTIARIKETGGPKGPSISIED
jgi:ATP-binding protein involved in chromosome partitioning